MQTYSWFRFKDVYSYEHDILVEKQPDIILPKKRITKHIIPGHNGNIYIDNGAYEATTKSIECSIHNIDRLDQIFSWLSGSGNLIFSNEPEKVYEAVILEQIPLQKVGIFFNYKRFPLIFEVNPIKHSVNAQNDIKTINKSPYTFYGDGTINALPIITISGNGDIVLDVNNSTIALSDISGHITLNSQSMAAYKNSENQNYKMFGDFPVLLPQGNKNVLNWYGSISKIEINPCWAWI